MYKQTKSKNIDTQAVVTLRKISLEFLSYIGKFLYEAMSEEKLQLAVSRQKLTEIFEAW